MMKFQHSPPFFFWLGSYPWAASNTENCHALPCMPQRHLVCGSVRENSNKISMMAYGFYVSAMSYSIPS